MPRIDPNQVGFVNQIAKQGRPEAAKVEPTKFADTLKEMIGQVDSLHKESGQAIEDFIAGKRGDLHEVMALGNEAQLSLQFLLEVRNKLVEAYQELSRMPV